MIKHFTCTDCLKWIVIENSLNGTQQVIAKFQDALDAYFFARHISGISNSSFFVTDDGDTGSTWQGGEEI